MSAQIFWQDEKTLTDGSVVVSVVLQDKITGAFLKVDCVDESHADELGWLLLKAGFNA
jgi:hypothetical protein